MQQNIFFSSKILMLTSPLSWNIICSADGELDSPYRRYVQFMGLNLLPQPELLTPIVYLTVAMDGLRIYNRVTFENNTFLCVSKVQVFGCLQHVIHGLFFTVVSVYFSSIMIFHVMAFLSHQFELFLFIYLSLYSPLPVDV